MEEIEHGQLRLLENDEIDQVSGGWTVTAPPQGNFSFLTEQGGLPGTGTGSVYTFPGDPAAIAAYFMQIANSQNSAPAGQNLVDTNGDGVPDSPEIVVTAPVTHSDIEFANNQAQWGAWGLGIAIGLFGTAYGYPISTTIVGGAIGTPVVSNPLVDANSDFMRRSVESYGGWQNYVHSINANRY